MCVCYMCVVSDASIVRVCVVCVFVYRVFVMCV